MKQKVADTDEGKREAILRTVYGGAKVMGLGNSNAIILPKAWVRLYGFLVNGSLWVSLTSEPGVLVIKPIDKEAAMKTMEANQCQVKTS